MSFTRILLLLILAVSLASLAGHTTATAPPPAEPILVTFSNPGPDTLAELAGQGWDIWGQTPDSGVIAQIMPALAVIPQAQGLDVQVVATAAELKAWDRFPACYRTYADAVTQLHRWADGSPQLTELIDAGPSWETTKGRAERRLWVMRMTNEANVEPKPKLLLVALHHAREIMTPQVALNLIELLVTGYGVDADITWLLDQREVWVMPFANPDGYIKAEAGLDWRKNTNNIEPCVASVPPNAEGVDLNRNYGFEWGGPGASEYRCNLTYRGTAPFSEPETQAIRDLINLHHFDLVISLHSFGDLILYPWGYTDVPAPDATHLYRLARALAGFNGYSPQQSSDLYPTNGDTCDWVYGALGVPCLTFEIGGALDGYFWPDCKQQAAQWAENREALLYALKLLPDPFTLALAPRIRDLRLEQAYPRATVHALLDDTTTGGETITGGEVFVDEVHASGAGLPLIAADATWDAPVEPVTATLELAGLVGRHTLYVVASDELGHRSPPTALSFEVCYDLTGDGEVKADDIMRIASLWHDPAAQMTGVAVDINGDEGINIQDIMQVTAQWGRRCNAADNNP